MTWLVVLRDALSDCLKAHSHGQHRKDLCSSGFLMTAGSAGRPGMGNRDELRRRHPLSWLDRGVVRSDAKRVGLWKIRLVEGESMPRGEIATRVPLGVLSLTILCVRDDFWPTRVRCGAGFEHRRDWGPTTAAGLAANRPKWPCAAPPH